MLRTIALVTCFIVRGCVSTAIYCDIVLQCDNSTGWRCGCWQKNHRTAQVWFSKSSIGLRRCWMQCCHDGTTVNKAMIQEWSVKIIWWLWLCVYFSPSLILLNVSN